MRNSFTRATLRQVRGVKWGAGLLAVQVADRRAVLSVTPSPTPTITRSPVVTMSSRRNPRSTFMARRF